MTSGLFLETTILVARRIKIPSISKRIEAFCDKTKWVTGASEYSVLEYYNRVIKDAKYLAREIARRGYSEAKEHVAAALGAHSGHRRKQQICLLLLNLIDRNLWQPCFAGKILRDERARDAEMSECALAALREFIKWAVRDLKALADHWNNGTRCEWVKTITATDHASRLDSFVVKCRADEIHCGLLEFLERNRENLDKIRAELARLPSDQMTPELTNMQNVLDRWQTDPRIVCDYKNGCMILADLILALDSEHFPAIYTQNKKEFVPLGRALGKTVYYQPNEDKEPQCLVSS